MTEQANHHTDLPAVKKQRITLEDGDKLDRKQSIDILTRLVKSEPGPLVLSIDSAWGTGKTTFIDMWEHELTKVPDPYPVIHINTWETDYTDQPFASLIVSIRKYVADFDRDETNLVEKGCEKFSRTACNLLHNLPSIAVSVASGGAVSLKQAFGGPDTCDEIERYEAFAKAIDTFKLELTDFVACVSTAHGGKPVLLMVDELDRCRPTYAIAFLEVIKHLFSVPRLIFVLAINKDELAKSMKAIYGESSDTVGYLRRFFDVDFRLPDQSVNSFCDHLLAQYHISEKLSTADDKYGSLGHLQLVLRFLANDTHLDLRSIDNLVRRFSIILSISPNIQPVSAFIALLLFVKRFRPDVYASLRNEHSSLRVLLDNQDASHLRGILSRIPSTTRLETNMIVQGYAEYGANQGKFAQLLYDMRQKRTQNMDEVATRIKAYQIAEMHAKKAFGDAPFYRSCLDAIELANSFDVS
ncbi:MAG: hypothetical protein FJ222_05830 [Lentisphaerae bacterium]|nr:hypothetical protein [Lentisphaerota bacterium]